MTRAEFLSRRSGTIGVVLGGLLVLWAEQAGATTINVSATCTLQEAVTSVERAVFNPSPPPPPEPGCTFINDGQGVLYTIAVPSGTTVIAAEIVIRVSMTISGTGTSATTLATTPAVAFRVEGSPLPNPTLTLRALTLRKAVTTTAATSGVLVNGLAGPAHVALDRVRLANYTRDGIVLQGAPPDFTVDASVVDSTIENNTLAGVLSNDGGIFVSGSTVANNLGGGLRATLTDSSLRMEVVNSTISNNRGPDGAGLFVSVLGFTSTFDPQLLVVNSTLTGNQATGDGGGAFGLGATTRFERVTFTNNTAASDGGGVCLASDQVVFNAGDLSIFDSTFMNNRAANGGGAALLSLGTTAFGTIERSLFANNTASGDGGGVYAGGQFQTVNNSTFTGNSAARGGGHFHAGQGESHMSRCTVAGNSASQVGGGVYFVRSNPIFTGNLIATNNAPSSPDLIVIPDIGQIGFYCLIGDNAGATLSVPNGVDGNIAGSAGSPVNPMLGPLQNLGGPTQVRPLLAGSPAIDAVPLSQGYDNVDQRSFPRPQGNGFDIGSFELAAISNASIFGFEPINTWTSTAPLSQDGVRTTQGSFGMAVGGSGYRLLTSAPLTTPLSPLTGALLLDVFIPGNQPNPFWLGGVQMFGSCPSAGLDNVFLGQVELTGKPTNAFSTVSFSVPANLRTALGQSRTDCFFGVAVNMNATPTTPVLDNLRFGP
jgi:predicted outer membrane repeat protein